jgi:hypothetical protein
MPAERRILMRNVRRTVIALPVLFFGGLATGLPGRVAAQSAAPRVEVWKSPTCGCCKDWVKHMESNGFSVKVNEVPNTAGMRTRLGMAEKFGSCHTATIAGYVLEGHVPARDVRRLLKEKPAAVGLAVPGMPIGSPGMDGPDYGGRKDPYDVLLVMANSTATVYQSYR